MYAPGTQHSSLLPSYLTPGLSGAIAANLRAIKLLDHQHPDGCRDHRQQRGRHHRSRRVLPQGEREARHPDAGPDHALPDQRSRCRCDSARPPTCRSAASTRCEDPRLVRVGQLRGGRIGPARCAEGPRALHLAVDRRRRGTSSGSPWCCTTRASTDKIAQTLLEMVRGGIADLPIEVTVFCETEAPIDAAFLGALPFPVRELPALDVRGDARLARAAAGRPV